MSPITIRVAALTLAATLSLMGGTAFAAWPTDPAVNLPVCTAADKQWYPQIIPDGSGGAVITWHDYRSGGADIYAQRVDPDGTTLWTTDGAALCTDPASQWEPQLAPDGAGGAIIAWDDRRPGAAGIYAQRIDGGGTSLWAADGVEICIASGWQGEQQILADGTGGAFIVWTDDRVDYDIHAQRVDAAGTVLWATDGIPICTAALDQDVAQLVSDGLGGTIIVWEDGRTGITVYAQRVDAGGNHIWASNGVALVLAGGYQVEPQVVPDGSGGAIVVFEDSRNGSDDVYAQRVDLAGNVLWTTTGAAVCAAADDQRGPRPAPDGAGGAIVAWRDRRNSSDDIYAQRIDATGTRLWATDGVPLCMDASGQDQPEIVADGSGGAIIAWRDWRNGLPDVYAQRIDANGNVLWTVDGVPIATAAQDQKEQRLVTDRMGGAIIVWQDRRAGVDQNVYAQRVGADGALGTPTGAPAEMPAGRLAFLRTAPNPFRMSMTISLALGELLPGWLSGPPPLRLTVYDAGGRSVRSLADGSLGPGASRATWIWDGRDDAGRRVSAGMYFVRAEAGRFIDVRKVVRLR